MEWIEAFIPQSKNNLGHLVFDIKQIKRLVYFCVAARRIALTTERRNYYYF